ncbi:hypothetical protein AAMO2058_001228700 [Amorphochlora amoebiformis]
MAAGSPEVAAKADISADKKPETENLSENFHPDRLKRMAHGGALKDREKAADSPSKSEKERPRKESRKDSRREGKSSRSSSRGRRRRGGGRERERERGRRRRRDDSRSDSGDRGSREKRRKSKRSRRRRRSPSSSSPSSSPRPKKRSKRRERSIQSSLSSNFSVLPGSVSSISEGGGGFSSIPPSALPPGASKEEKAEYLRQMIKKQAEHTNRQLTRAGRRLYIGNLPISTGFHEKFLLEFFTDACKQLGVVAEEGPIIDIQVTVNQTFCFLEFRSHDLAMVALERFQGLTLADSPLKVARPKDFSAPPSHLVDFVCKGPKDIMQTQKSTAQTSALATINQVQSQIEEAKRRAAAATALVMAQQAAKNKLAEEQKDEESCVLVLFNMVRPGDLLEDDEYNEIRNEIGNECSKFGHLVDVVIPRPGGEEDDIEETFSEEDEDEDIEAKQAPGVGRVFLQYNSKEDASKARSVLHGRRFADNLVKATFYSEEKFFAKDYAA